MPRLRTAALRVVAAAAAVWAVSASRECFDTLPGLAACPDGEMLCVHLPDYPVQAPRQTKRLANLVAARQQALEIDSELAEIEPAPAETGRSARSAKQQTKRLKRKQRALEKRTSALVRLFHGAECFNPLMCQQGTMQRSQDEDQKPFVNNVCYRNHPGSDKIECPFAMPPIGEGPTRSTMRCDADFGIQR